MTNVNYKTLKSNIIKACRAFDPHCNGAVKFEVDYSTLSDLVEDTGLVPLNVGMSSEKVVPDIILYLSEYFEKKQLSWFTDNKHYTVIAFIDAEAIDKKASKLIKNLNKPQVDDPEDDKVNDIATLIAEYPCYFATIVSYRSNDPKRAGKLSYEIVCRANKVVIKSSDYQYNPKDFS